MPTTPWDSIREVTGPFTLGAFVVAGVISIVRVVCNVSIRNTKAKTEAIMKLPSAKSPEETMELVAAITKLSGATYPDIAQLEESSRAEQFRNAGELALRDHTNQLEYRQKNITTFLVAVFALAVLLLIGYLASLRFVEQKVGDPIDAIAQRLVNDVDHTQDLADLLAKSKPEDSRVVELITQYGLVQGPPTRGKAVVDALLPIVDATSVRGRRALVVVTNAYFQTTDDALKQDIRDRIATLKKVRGFVSQVKTMGNDNIRILVNEGS